MSLCYLDDVLAEHFHQIATLAEDYYELGYVMSPVGSDYWQLIPASEVMEYDN